MVNIKELEVVIDTREPDNTLKMIQKIFPRAKKEYLEIGDIKYESVHIELKSFQDFIASIIDERYKNQLHNFLINPDIRGYYIIYGDWKEINKYSQIKMQAVLGAIASLVARHPTQLLILPNKEYAIYCACKIIEKTNDHKEVKPITYKATTDDRAVNMLMESAERIQEKAVRNALEQFGTVKNVINSTPKELGTVKYIGKETVNRFFETINRDFSKKETELTDNKLNLIDEQKDKLGNNNKNSNNYDDEKEIVFSTIEIYTATHKKPCPYSHIQEIFPKINSIDMKTIINDLIMESRIYYSGEGLLDVF